MKIQLVIGFILLLLPAVAVGQDAASPTFYLGADLSYVNEMEDCGAVYHVDGHPRDPYEIFHDYGANLVRLRLWHTPDWTEYSTFDDVVRALRRAHALGMNAMLDFHYSDTWADPSKQIIPAAWADITDLDELGQALYQYTYDTLMELDSLGLMPELVQVGNEINTEILRPEGASGYPINWERNAFLLNQAIRAVRDADAQSAESPRIVLNIAQPEDAEGWLLAAERAGVTDFDIIGIAYYPGWSRHAIETAGGVINQLRYRFGKDVMVVETAYPWTLDGVNETADNILDAEFLVEGYSASPDGQRQFLIDLTQAVFANGGLGVVYWEPAWVSTPCRTLWGQGSHWENGTFFDFDNDNEVLPGIEFLQYDYTYPVEVTLQFSFEESGDSPEEIFFWGDFTGQGRRLLPVVLADGTYTFHARFLPNTDIHYQFYSSPPASTESALVADDCVDGDGLVAMTIPSSSGLIAQTDSACPLVVNAG
jgi:arabinogalactan endo-1,4-beta-galactosidase